MEIRFEESGAVKDVYFAMLDDRVVGLIAPEGKHWKATVYRNHGDDGEATTTQRHTAEAFIRNNVTVPVEE